MSHKYKGRGKNNRNHMAVAVVFFFLLKHQHSLLSHQVCITFLAGPVCMWKEMMCGAASDNIRCSQTTGLNQPVQPQNHTSSHTHHTIIHNHLELCNECQKMVTEKKLLLAKIMKTGSNWSLRLLPWMIGISYYATVYVRGYRGFNLVGAMLREK